ncbi:tyrosine-type recombinase/integrase [Candidatus Solincola sp.]|nr:hypothetical protein [Actinomycetota bacterium]MDI7251056.1 hypothetical protein [Actinomycetota bacterium]
MATGPRRRDAEVLLRRVLEEVAAGTYGVREEDPAFAEFARSFLEAKREELKPTTFKDYSEVVSNHLLPVLGKSRLREKPLWRYRNSSSGFRKRTSPRPPWESATGF